MKIIRLMIAGGPKTKARRIRIGLHTKDEEEAKKRAAIVKIALARAELIRAGLSLPRGRQPNQLQ